MNSFFFYNRQGLDNKQSVFSGYRNLSYPLPNWKNMALITKEKKRLRYKKSKKHSLTALIMPLTFEHYHTKETL